MGTNSNKSFNQQELERLKYLKKDLETRGFQAFLEDMDILLSYVIKTVNSEIEVLEKKVKEEKDGRVDNKDT